ncbi:MAG: hypothetical protein [Chaetfec virus UA24_144]|nr:MAG: hypothetical protein [Chaetfec virus UA24_144]
MFKKTITYTDYNGLKRTEDFYFNLTKAECMDLELSRSGGLTSLIDKIVAEQDVSKISELFKEIINKSYGEKSPDGRRFIKNQEILDSFVQTEAYSELYMELATDSTAAAEFVNGILPVDLSSAAAPAAQLAV